MGRHTSSTIQYYSQSYMQVHKLKHYLLWTLLKQGVVDSHAALDANCFSCFPNVYIDAGLPMVRCSGPTLSFIANLPWNALFVRKVWCNRKSDWWSELVLHGVKSEQIDLARTQFCRGNYTSELSPDNPAAMQFGQPHPTWMRTSASTRACT